MRLNPRAGTARASSGSSAGAAPNCRPATARPACSSSAPNLVCAAATTHASSRPAPRTGPHSETDRPIAPAGAPRPCCSVAGSRSPTCRAPRRALRGSRSFCSAWPRNCSPRTSAIGCRVSTSSRRSSSGWAITRRACSGCYPSRRAIPIMRRGSLTSVRRSCASPRSASICIACSTICCSTRSPRNTVRVSSRHRPPATGSTNACGAYSSNSRRSVARRVRRK